MAVPDQRKGRSTKATHEDTSFVDRSGRAIQVAEFGGGKSPIASSVVVLVTGRDWRSRSGQDDFPAARGACFVSDRTRYRSASSSGLLGSHRSSLFYAVPLGDFDLSHLGTQGAPSDPSSAA